MFQLLQDVAFVLVVTAGFVVFVRGLRVALERRDGQRATHDA